MNTDTDLKITTAKCFAADRPRMRALGKRLKALDKGAGSSQPCVISRALDALDRETKAGIEAFNNMDPKKGGVR